MSVGAAPAPLAWSSLAQHRSRAEKVEAPAAGPPCGRLQSHSPRRRQRPPCRRIRVLRTVATSVESAATTRTRATTTRRFVWTARRPSIGNNTRTCFFSRHIPPSASPAQLLPHSFPPTSAGTHAPIIGRSGVSVFVDSFTLVTPAERSGLADVFDGSLHSTQKTCSFDVAQLIRTLQV